MSTQIQTQPENTIGLMTAGNFELSYRVAKMLSESTILPNEYRGNIPNCMIALNMAFRIGADPMMTMQNLIIIHGRPTWSSQFLISTFNTCGRFSSIRYEFFGEKGTDEYGCRANAIELSTGEMLTGTDVTIAIAKAEGWYGKNGSKWKTMPQQMLQYRAAAWFIRTIAPEISMGLHTQDEVIDIEPIDVTPVREKPPIVKDKVKSRSVDSLVGGAAETIIEPKPVPVEQPAPEPTPTDLPPIKPAPEPTPAYDPNHVQNEWRKRMMECGSMVDFMTMLNEMPVHYKQNVFKADLAQKQAELKEIEAQSTTGSIVNFDAWNKKITECNSREQFMKLQKEMPEVVRNDAKIKENLKIREDFGMQNNPANW